MIGGIKNLIGAVIQELKPHGPVLPLDLENTMITTMTQYPHIILIDYQDFSTGYHEIDSLRETHLTAEALKQEHDIAYFRVRFADGTEICWENHNKEVEM